jgi:hypothetical protein
MKKITIEKITNGIGILIGAFIIIMAVSAIFNY